MTSRRSGRLLSSALTLALTSTLAAGFAPAASAAPVLTVPASGQYTEQAPPTAVAEGVTLTGGGSYAGRSMSFAVGGATGTEALSLIEDSAPVTTDGVISVVGGTVYRGNGTTADPVASVDAVQDGQGGRTLTVNFTQSFDNAGFEQGLGGWTLYEHRVDLGVTSLGGFVSQDTSTYPSNTVANDDREPGDWNSAAPRTYTVSSTTAGEPTEGTSALQLLSRGLRTASPCDVVHGPAVASAAFVAAQGDTLYFDWRAFAGDDAAHVSGYLLDEQGTQIEVIDATTGGLRSTSWATSETVIPRGGEYRFVFVGGTHDYSCGQLAGASLLIDNVKVFGNRATDDVVQKIVQKLAYADTSDDPSTSRTIDVTVASANGTGTGSIGVQVTPVDDAPVFTGAAPEARFVNNEPDETFPSVTGTLTATDPEGDVLTYGLPGGTAQAATVDGVSYTHQQTTPYGTLHLDAASGNWVVVADDAAVEARTSSTSLVVPVSVGSNALSAQRDLTIAVDVPPSAPGAPTGLTAVAGDGQVVLSWTAPAWSGGTPAEGHRVEISADGGTTWTVASATASPDTTWTVTGLTNGTPYTFRVSATNATGTGAPSAPATATPYTLPGAPALTGVTAGNRTLVLAVTPPSTDGGSPVTGYRVSTDGGTTWTAPMALVDGTLTLRGRGLENGRTYALVVQAVNAAGPGPSSASLPGAPVRQPVPHEPVTPAAPVAVTVDGSRTTPQVTSDGDGVAVQGADFTLRFTGMDGLGRPLAGDQGTVRLEQGGWVRLQGTGYRPGSTVDVWALGAGTSLGDVTVGPDGRFDQWLPLTGLRPGAVTLQANGVLADGRTVNATIAGTVAAAPVPAAVVARAVPGAVAAAATVVSGALPRTGGGVAGTLAAALALLGAGGLLVARRRVEGGSTGA